MDEPKRYAAARMPAPLYARLEAMARAENNTISSIIRRLLTRALAREEQTRVVEQPRPRKRAS